MNSFISHILMYIYMDWNCVKTQKNLFPFKIYYLKILNVIAISIVCFLSNIWRVMHTIQLMGEDISTLEFNNLSHFTWFCWLLYYWIDPFVILRILRGETDNLSDNLPKYLHCNLDRFENKNWIILLHLLDSWVNKKDLDLVMR